jgi:hypothetical protein
MLVRVVLISPTLGPVRDLGRAYIVIRQITWLEEVLIEVNTKLDTCLE